MHIHGPEETARLLPYPALADACAAMLLARAAGRAQAPQRLHLSLANGGTLLVMPASDERLAMTKLVTVHPANPDRSLPTIQGEVVVMDAATGERLGILDGPTLTARRTASVSLLAARLLAGGRARRGPLLLVGAGIQARGHLEAFHHGLGTEKVMICSRTRASAERLAAHARTLGMKAEVLDSPGAGLDCSDMKRAGMVVTATTSVEPVLPESVPEGVFIAAIGAFRPHMAELPAALLRAARVVIDTEGALTEAGELVQGGLGRDDVELLEDLLDAQPETDTTVVFKGTGHALFDLAAARLAFAPGQ